MKFSIVESELIAAKPYFTRITPGWGSMLTGRVAWVGKQIMTGRRFSKLYKKAPETDRLAWMAGTLIGDSIIDRGVKPARTAIARQSVRMQSRSKRDLRRKNGLGGRSWITETGQQPMVIIFHDANKAGPHIDVHIGRLSLIYRVPTDTYNQLRYNRDGYLTENSKKLLLDHVRGEIAQRSWVPQNLDHSVENARMSWVGGSREDTGYGAATTRQIVAESTVDVYKAGPDHPIELYAPLLNSHRGLYIFRLGDEGSDRAPSVVFGVLDHHPPVLEERLHLKMIDPNKIDDWEDLADRVDWKTSAKKYDGSSSYFEINKKGTKVYSPRKSKKTGEQIEYTFKLDGIANTTSDETITGMGEVMFRRKGQKGYMPQAEASGLLNANIVLPEDVTPEIRIYRIDRVGRDRYYGEEFWANRERQEQVAALDPKHFKVVELATPVEAADEGYEGVVVVPHGGSVVDGFKIKWWQDADDWIIEKVAFHPGEKGGVAGVVWCKSDTSGKTFKLGPGQMGNEDLTRTMMADPDAYEGMVIKVQSRHGHEGRAAKVQGFHDDKGFAIS